MQKLTIILLFIFVSHLMAAQNFSNYEINSPYSDGFFDFLDLNDSYLLIGSQFGINPYLADYNKHRNFFVKLNKDGTNPNIYFTDTFGVDYLNITAVFYNKQLYTIGVDHISTDTAMILRISKRDTALNLISVKTFPDIKREKLFIDQKAYVVDSVLTIFGAYRKAANLDFWTVLIQINLNDLSVLRTKYFTKRFFFNDYLSASSEKILIGSLYDNNGLGHSNTIIKCDSAFNIIDTVDLSYGIRGNSNILRYRDSLYIVTGFGVNFWPFDPYFPTQELELQLLDTGFRFITAKTFNYNDSTIARAGYVQNIVKNDSNEYFIGAYIEDNFQQMHPEAGVLIVKLDSNLNTIWQKHIPGNANYNIARLMPTPDGGVVFILGKGPTTGYNYDVAFVKLSSNGGLTSFSYITPTSFRNVELFPNPSVKQITLRVRQSGQQIEYYELYDLQGRLLLSQRIDSRQKQISVEALPAGIYILRGKLSNAETFSVKFIKED